MYNQDCEFSVADLELRSIYTVYNIYNLDSEFSVADLELRTGYEI